MTTTQNVRTSSIDCYYAKLDRFGHQSATIIAYMQVHPGQDFTRRELAQAVGMETSSVAGRVNQLVADGDLVELPRRKCRISSVSSHALRLPAAQGELL